MARLGTIKTKNIPIHLFSFFVFLYILLTSATWIGVNLPATPVVGAMNVLLLLCLFPIYYRLDYSRVIIALCCLCLVGAWFAIIRNIIFGTFIFLKLLPAIYLLVLPFSYKTIVLKFCTKWYSIFLACSLVLYLITIFVPIPPFLGLFIEGEGVNYPPFLNYLFYIRPTLLSDYDIMRFNGFALEPGHMAISTIFFLVANKFEFKNNRYLWILLIAIIVSLSLAGYVLLAVAWILLKTKGFKSIFITAFIGGTIFIGAQIWNEGDNYINNNILERLEFDEQKGIKGNNRTTQRLDYEYDQLFKKGQVLSGAMNDDSGKLRGAGHKKYILMYGLMGAIVTFVYYWSVRSPACNKRYAICFLILVIITWFDCEYPTWFSWLAPYVLGIGTSFQNQHKKSANSSKVLIT